MTNRTGAVVVNFASAAESAQCASSLLENGVDEVVVVDNDTEEPCAPLIAARAPGARVLELGVNLGYGAAANRGVAALTPGVDAVIICNPDITFTPGSVETLVKSLDGSDLAIAGPTVERPDGSTYPSARREPDPLTAAGHALVGFFVPDNRFSRRYRMDGTHGPESGTHARVDWVSGSCMAVRRTAFESVGGFDERFFMYLEDVDLCRRMRGSGWDIAYVPEAVVVHAQGVSTATRRFSMVVHHHRSAMIFAARTLRGWRTPMVPAAWAVLTARGALALVREAFRRRS